MKNKAIKNLVLVSLIVLIVSCNNKTESKENKASEIKQESNLKFESKTSENYLKFEKYFKEGLLLRGQVKLFDKKLNQVGQIQVEEITAVQILEKSTERYNIGKSTDYCSKANLLKVKYKDNDYLVFGQDVYEINQNEVSDLPNNLFVVFPVTNFEMGASDEEGLTDCDEYSYLIVFNKKTNKYLTIEIPDNQENIRSQKFASLIHDDGLAEKIYSIKMIHDVLILGIKISYQEGYGSYFLKTNSTDNFIKSIITDHNRFDDESKYEELK